MEATSLMYNKLRHVWGDTARNNKQFKNLRPLTYGESNYISANDRFIAISIATGGGKLNIFPLDKPEITKQQSILSLHKGKILDHDFHPFIPNIIGTVSEDLSIGITSFPINGILSHDIQDISV